MARTSAHGKKEQMNTKVETLAQIDATAAPGSPRLLLLRQGSPETKSRDIGLPWTPHLARAFRCSRVAQREERNGFPYTAAMEWRHAAELSAPDTRAVEYCWREWERIMQLPRRLAEPAGAAPAILRVI
jgi:hypothetical protein